MPTYEYLCKACSHRFETWQKMVDDPLTTCPECGGNIRRVLYPAGVVFKGSGFYKTDYSNNNNKPLPATNGNGTNGEAKKAGSSTESKPASESTSSTSESSASSTASSSSSSNGSSASTTSTSTK